MNYTIIVLLLLQLVVTLKGSDCLKEKIPQNPLTSLNVDLFTSAPLQALRALCMNNSRDNNPFDQEFSFASNNFYPNKQTFDDTYNHLLTQVLRTADDCCTIIEASVQHQKTTGLIAFQGRIDPYYIEETLQIKDWQRVLEYANKVSADTMREDKTLMIPVLVLDYEKGCQKAKKYLEYLIRNKDGLFQNFGGIHLTINTPNPDLKRFKFVLSLAHKKGLKCSIDASSCANAQEILSLLAQLPEIKQLENPLWYTSAQEEKKRRSISKRFDKKNER